VIASSEEASSRLSASWLSVLGVRIGDGGVEVGAESESDDEDDEDDEDDAGEASCSPGSGKTKVSSRGDRVSLIDARNHLAMHCIGIHPDLLRDAADRLSIGTDILVSLGGCEEPGSTGHRYSGDIQMSEVPGGAGNTTDGPEQPYDGSVCLALSWWSTALLMHGATVNHTAGEHSQDVSAVRNARLDGSSGLFGAVAALLQVIQSGGDAEFWASVAQSQEGVLPQFLWSLLGGSSPPALRCIAMEALYLLQQAAGEEVTRSVFAVG